MSRPNEYDFSGYATKFDVLCSDGRVITKDAFAHMDGEVVPLVWNHDHNSPSNLLGHAYLEARDDGMYTYGSFNKTSSGVDAKEALAHGDVDSLSIYANHIRQRGNSVVHGAIREISLVLAGANPGAKIDTVMMHSDDPDEISEEQGIIYCGEKGLEIVHAESEPEEKKEEPKMAEDKEKTVGEVVDEIKKKLSDEEFDVFMGLIGAAASGKDNDEDEGEKEMKQNAFANDRENDAIVHADNGDVYISAEEMNSVVADAKRLGSMRESVIQHNITDIDFLFPEPKNLNTPPEWIKRDTDWVAGVMNGVRKTPFSRIRSTFANITADEARARGYVKGQQKVGEVFPLLKRTTDPQTVYKMQKFDRDDIIDITDFDVIAWVKAEMRLMLEEEIARAILVGDGRESGTDYSISHDHIRPIWTDNDLYTVKVPVSIASTATPAQKAKAQIQAIIRARKFYKGSGNPTFYTTEDVLTEMLLIEDLNQRIIYDTEEKLARALRVSKIVTVPVMENLTREVNGENRPLVGLIVNLNDYNVGADKGGAVRMFDDFDINFNKLEYLIETRCSGALVKPYSALAVEMDFTQAS